MSGISPKDVYNPDELSSTFGCIEFEKALTSILGYLQDDSRGINDFFGESEGGFAWGDHPKRDVPKGWDKLFSLGEIPEVHPAVVVALAASGWIQHHWFPKWTFYLTSYAVGRIIGHHEKFQSSNKGGNGI